MPTTPATRIRAGRLRFLGSILQPVTTAGIQKWATFATAWMDVTPAQGTETASASLGPTNEVFEIVTMRYQQGISPKMRILFRGRTLEIVSVFNVDEQDHQLQFACREVVN